MKCYSFIDINTTRGVVGLNMSFTTVALEETYEDHHSK